MNTVTAEWITTSKLATEFPQRFEDDYLRGDTYARGAFIEDAIDFE